MNFKMEPKGSFFITGVKAREVLIELYFYG